MQHSRHSQGIKPTLSYWTLFFRPGRQGKIQRLIWKPSANINEFFLTNPLRSITVISGIILNTYMGHTVFLKFLFRGIWQNLWRDYFLCNDPFCNDHFKSHFFVPITEENDLLSMNCRRRIKTIEGLYESLS